MAYLIIGPWEIMLEFQMPNIFYLTHLGRVTHICVSELTIIGSDNGLSPGRRQAIIWTNVGIFLIRPLGTNFNEMLVEILTFSFMKMRLKVSSAKWRPFCLGLNVVMISSVFISEWAFIWIPLYLSDDTSTSVQEWLGAVSHQTYYEPIITQT